MRWQTVAAGALLVGLAVIAIIAFRGGGDGPSVAASAAPSPTESGSPTPSPSPSPSPTQELVLPENDVDDPLEAIVAIEAYRDWLYANPDPLLARHIFHEGCGCREPLETALQRLQDSGERIMTLGESHLSELTVETTETDRVVWVNYAVLLPAIRHVAADGTVIEEVEAADEVIHRRARLFREPSGRWRVLRVEDLASG